MTDVSTSNSMKTSFRIAFIMTEDRSAVYFVCVSFF